MFGEKDACSNISMWPHFKKKGFKIPHPQKNKHYPRNISPSAVLDYMKHLFR